MILLWLVLLPFRIALGLTGFTFKAGYRTGRVIGYGRLFTLGAGVAIGLLIAPGPGRELREKLRQRFEGYTPPAPADAPPHPLAPEADIATPVPV